MAYNYNYDKLMEHNPTSYGKMTNSIGQEIDFLEHPTQGDMSEVICACHALKAASDSTFFDTDDMKAEHGEYEPVFIDGRFYIGALERVHISKIKSGDAIFHDECVKTVCNRTIKEDSDGKRLFGDSYNLGNKLVIRVRF